jgi:hypothetical protein
MKDKNAGSLILGGLVGLFFIYLTGSMTFSLLARVLPGQVSWQYGGLVAFDGALLLWFVMFLFFARGKGQRNLSVTMMIVTALLTGIAVVAEIILRQAEGAGFVEIPQSLGAVVVISVIVAVIGNLYALYLFHMLDQKMRELTRKNQAQDLITDRALDFLEEGMEEIAAAVAAELGEEMRRKALYSLGVDPKRYIGGGRVIESTARDPEQKRRKIFFPSLFQQRNGKAEYNTETEQAPDPTRKARE